MMPTRRKLNQNCLLLKYLQDKNKIAFVRLNNENKLAVLKQLLVKKTIVNKKYLSVQHTKSAIIKRYTTSECSEHAAATVNT